MSVIFGAERVRPIQSPDPSLNNDAVNVRSHTRIKSTANHPHTIEVRFSGTRSDVSAFVVLLFLDPPLQILHHPLQMPL